MFYELPRRHKLITLEVANGRTQVDVAKQFGISQQRAHQIVTVTLQRAHCTVHDAPWKIGAGLRAETVKFWCTSDPDSIECFYYHER